MTQPSQAQPLYAAGPVLKSHRAAAVLILGILSVVLFPCTGIVLGIIAWCLGAADLRDMRSGLMDRSGEGMTRAGKICGIVGVTFAVAFYALIVLAIVLRATHHFHSHWQYYCS